MNIMKSMDNQSISNIMGVVIESDNLNARNWEQWDHELVQLLGVPSKLFGALSRKRVEVTVGHGAEEAKVEPPQAVLDAAATLKTRTRLVCPAIMLFPLFPCGFVS